MSKNQSNNKWFSKILKLCLICGLCVSFYYVGLSKRQDNSDIIKAKDEIITKLNTQYESLSKEHKKSQELINATTNEIKRLTQELKEYRNTEKSELVFNESNTNLGIAIVSDHIKMNESFSAKPYCDSDGKYRNGYGTEAKFVTYNVGDKVKVRNCKGKNITLIATKDNRLLPERAITEQEALSRKEAHLIKHVFPYLYGKHFRSQEEFIVATDVIYNRGIAQSKTLFNSDGTINCKSLYNYMDHSKKAYQQVMRKRYAKNYALCIQS